jgi:hypothetical protein
VSASACEYGVKRTLRRIQFKQGFVQAFERSCNRTAFAVEFRLSTHHVERRRYRTRGTHVACNRYGFRRKMSIHFDVRAMNHQAV